MKQDKCDGCGAISPDEDGLWQGNHWFEISVQERCKEDKQEYLLCRNCMGITNPTPAPSIGSWLGRLRDALLRHCHNGHMKREAARAAEGE